MKLSDIPEWRLADPRFPGWLAGQRERHCIGDDASGWRCAWKVDGEPCGAPLGPDDLVLCDKHEVIRLERAEERARERQRQDELQRLCRAVRECELVRELPDMPFARVGSDAYTTNAPKPFKSAATRYGAKSGSVLLLGPPGTWKTATTVALVHRLVDDAIKQAEALSVDELRRCHSESVQYWDEDSGCIARHPTLATADDGTPILASLLIGGHWVDAQELATARRRAKLGTESPGIRRAKMATLLIIDEMGPQAQADREQVIFEVLNHRYRARRPTICTSGLTEAEFRVLHGDGLLRRLTEEHTGRLLSVHGRGP